MAKQTRNTLKGYFETGKKPVGTNYADLIDSNFNLTDDNIGDLLLDGDISASGTGSFDHIRGPVDGHLDITSYNFIRLYIDNDSGDTSYFKIFSPGGTSGVFAVGEDGKTGIGISSPGNEMLTVEGDISSSGFVSASSFSGDGSGLTNLPSSTAAGTISSSAQIATEITGAFHAASSSFSTRVTTNDAKVGYTDAAVVVVLNDYGVISGSAQLPSGIFSSSLQTFTNITASGNLSVSGSIYSDQYVYNKTTSATDGVSTGDIIYWGEATATTAGKNVEAYAIAYNVNDNMSVSVATQDVEYDKAGAAATNVTETIDAFNASYTMGAASVRATISEADNDAGTTGTTDEHMEISLILSF